MSGEAEVVPSAEEAVKKEREAAELRAREQQVFELRVGIHTAQQAAKVLRNAIAKLEETAVLCEVQAEDRQAKLKLIEAGVREKELDGKIFTKDAEISRLEGELAEMRARVAGLKPKHDVATSSE